MIYKEQLKQGKLNSFFIKSKVTMITQTKTKILKKVLKVYQQEPGNSILITTDTLGEIKEAKSVDVNSIAVTWWFQKEETLQKGNSYKIIDQSEKLGFSIRNYFNKN